MSLAHPFVTLHGVRELLCQPLGRHFHARVHLHRQRLRIAPLVDRQLDQVLPRHHPRSVWLACCIAIDGRDRVRAWRSLGRRIVQIPDKPVRARSGRQNLRRANPVRGHIETLLDDRLRLVGSCITTHKLVLTVQNLQRHRAGSGGVEAVINDRAIRRILPRRLLGRQRRIRIHVPADAVGGLRPEEMRRRRDYIRVELPQRRDVVENPERSAVRAHDDVVAVDDEVANRCRRHVQPQRLPICAVVERDMDGSLRPGEKQAFARWVFSDRVDGGVVGQAVDNLLPRLAGVVRAIDVRPLVVEAETIYGRVGRIGIEATGVDDR